MSESKFRILFEFANDCLMVLDLDGRIRDINRTGYERLGYTKEEMVGKKVSQFDSPEFAAKVPAKLGEIHGKGQVIFESVHLRRDGSVMPIEINARVVELDGRQQIFSVVRDISDRKKEEEQFKLTIRTSLDGFWITDERGHFLEVNDAYRQLVGYSLEELLNMGISDVEVIETPEDTAQHIRQLIETGSVRFETRHRARDGHILDIEVSATHTSSYGGRIYCFLRDITERKRAQAILLKSEANLRATLDNLPYLTWLKDINGRYITINKAFADYLHLENPQQAEGRTDLDLQPMDLAERYRADDALVIEENRQKHVEEPAFDGKNVHWVETFKTPIVDNSGKVLGTVGFARDITERKLIEESLRESAQRLQAHIENSPMAVVAWDKNFNVTQWSGAAERMFGWNAAETIGKPIMDLHMIYEEDIPLVQETMAKLTAGTSRYVISSNRNVTKDGRIIHCDWYNSVLSDEEGSMASVMSQVLDISDRERMQQEMIAMNNQLSHEVAMRTADLSALTAHIQKIAEIEKANLARELHDELGSTLVGISMEVSRLSGRISSPDVLQDLSQIRDLLSRAVQTTRGVVNQLYPTVLDNIGLVAAIGGLVNEFRKHSGITIDLVTPKEPIDAEHTYALAVYRITQECLTNIAKHAEASKVHIELGISGRILDLTIRDNGKGLPSTIKTGGHGIFGMVERARYLGGSMEITSGQGKGSSAHLSLPLSTAKPKGKKKVLVVDDHASVRNAIRQILDGGTDGFSVEGEAEDGRTAVQMAISEDWDIVLLDINLPIKNGIKALEEIVAAKPDLPIIILSTYAEEEYGEIATSRGAACYLEKGNTDRLVEAMRRAVSLRQAP